MRAWICKSGLYVFLFFVNVAVAGMTVSAAGEPVMKEGIYVEDMDVSGLTVKQTRDRIEAYIDELRGTELTLLAAEDNRVIVTPGELGIRWVNTEIVDEAVQLGTVGNVIERYKAIKDLENDQKIYDLAFDFDIQAIDEVIRLKAIKYDKPAVDYMLERADKQFRIVPGQIGYGTDMEASIDTVYDYLTTQWDHKPCEIGLKIGSIQPRGSEEELAVVQDVLGTYTTSFRSSGAARSKNVKNGSDLINGALLYPGDVFSTLEHILPFTTANGYEMAGSYLNGKVVDSLGGGICQVSTTLYNAVLLSELEVTERYNHSMSVTYVPPANDAAIAESAGKDFKFINTSESPVYIEGIIKDKKITFNIYGKETRPENRKVRYESEILEVINPTSDNIIADASKPLGYIAAEESAHIGYKARLWKIVTEDGKEVSRTQVNSSKYKMTPKSAVVGVSTPDPNAYNEIMAAIGTGSIAHVKNVIALLQNAQQAASQHIVIGDI